MKTLHQSFNDGMVNPEVVCHPSMAKTTVMHANSLPQVLDFATFVFKYFQGFQAPVRTLLPVKQVFDRFSFMCI
jgi:hypothetical protein